MNIRFKSRYLAFALSLCVFFSCKKDDAPGTPTPEQKPTLFETVQGKWAATVTPPARVSNPAALGAPKASMKVEDMGEIAYIEFFKDSSCLITSEYGQPLYHKISVKDSTSFTFGQVYTDLTEVKVAGDSISFNVTHGDQVVTVKAAKVADLVLNPDRKSLVNEWLVTHEEDGDSLYNAGNNGNSFPDGTQVYFQLTAAGTFVQKISYGGDVSVAMAFDWKLDPDHSDIIKIYSPFFYDYDGYAPFVRILSLTASAATVQLVNYVEVNNNNNNVNNSGKVSGGPDYEERVTTLVLAKK